MFIVKKLLVFETKFTKSDVKWAISLGLLSLYFLFFIEIFLGDAGTRQGKALVSLIEMGWLGAMLYFFSIFGSLVYVISVITATLVNKLIVRGKD